MLKVDMLSSDVHFLQAGLMLSVHYIFLKCDLGMSHPWSQLSWHLCHMIASARY